MNLEILTEDLIKEFAIDEKTGVGSVSRRGLSRLCGVSRSTWGKGGHFFTQKIDGFLARHGFEGGNIFDGDGRILDVPAALVIRYYSRKGYEVAMQTDDALVAMSLRMLIQKTLNWSQRPVTAKEIVELLVLPVPAPYSPKFEVEFYHQLSRLTGLTPRGHLRPQYWASLTKELVYEQMPEGVYQEIKQWQLATDPNKKLHQFLTEDGIDVLKRHLDELLLLMKSSVSIWELRESLTRVKKSLFQLSLPIGKN